MEEKKMEEKKIGEVIKFFGKIGVAAIRRFIKGGGYHPHRRSYHRCYSDDRLHAD